MAKTTLQWGRDVSVADVSTEYPELVHKRNDDASMGPRRFRRGCQVPRRRHSGRFLASMGPRRFRRGCLEVTKSCAEPCGGFNGAATFPSRMW